MWFGNHTFVLLARGGFPWAESCLVDLLAAKSTHVCGDVFPTTSFKAIWAAL